MTRCLSNQFNIQFEVFALHFQCTVIQNYALKSPKNVSAVFTNDDVQEKKTY